MDTKNNKRLFVHDMVHNNPGMAPYQSKFNDPEFLKQRGYDGKVFDLQESAQLAILWEILDRKNNDREKVFPLDSEEYQWVVQKQQKLKHLYQNITNSGLSVMFMMDMIVLPQRVLKIYPEILDSHGKIDIMSPKMREILDALFDEIFSVFPEIEGIYIRFGETYIGPRFGAPYHTGNNPILHDEEKYHLFLINYLREKVCKEHNRKLYYRTWGFGKFQYEPNTYLKISNSIEPHENLFFCIKHTAGDFHRTFPFNQCLNVGKHRQVIEVQLSREYEGKGAYPNYIADGVINGFEEYKNNMATTEKQCLRDVLGDPNSLIAGIWTWSRGGGWGGPYIMGSNDVDGHVVVKHGAELWPDVNAYVIAHWCGNTAMSDKHYAIEYAKEILHYDNKDAELFYEILMKSEHAILLGRGCNTTAYTCDVFWTRDQNIEYARIMKNIKNAIASNSLDLFLSEHSRSVAEWKMIENLSNNLSASNPNTDYIQTTCQYGSLLFQIFEVICRANAYAAIGGHAQEVQKAVSEYDSLWKIWFDLNNGREGCPTLYAKEDQRIDLIGYDWNKGLDSAVNPLRQLDDRGEVLLENQVKVLVDNGWGLTGTALN